MFAAYALSCKIALLLQSSPITRNRMLKYQFVRAAGSRDRRERPFHRARINTA